jgi:hypothetical protein
VIVKGLMLTNLNVFGDSTANVTDVAAAIRLTNATSVGPQPSPGDSVRVLGTVATRAGQPVLDSARVTAFQAGPPPAPVDQTTLQANTAEGGAHDAALVFLNNAVIQTDTATVNGDYTFSVDDGSGSVKVVPRSGRDLSPSASSLPARPSPVVVSWCRPGPGPGCSSPG